MNYQYLRGLPASILPKVEFVLIKAEQGNSLTDHLGVRTPVRDARAFVVQGFCGCAAVLCEAVADGDVAYVDLSPQLDFLRRALIADALNRSDIRRKREFERGPSDDDFARGCNALIDQTPSGTRCRLAAWRWPRPRRP